MKKRGLKRLEFFFEWGLKGLKMSFYMLLILLVVLVLLFLRVYSLDTLILVSLQVPENSLDFLAILGGIIIFIILPFLIGISIGLKKKKQK